MKKIYYIVFIILFLILFSNCKPPIESKWVEYNQSIIPAKRLCFSMAYVNIYGNPKIFLFGGKGPEGVFNDLWEYDINTNIWNEIEIVGNKPIERYGHSIAYSGNNIIVLFGGYDESIHDPLQDTWEYNINTKIWTEYNSGEFDIRPVKLCHLRMSYIGGNKAILFGGNTPAQVGSIYPDTTWEYDSTTHLWTDINPTNKPAGRFDHSLTYDFDRNKVILFGGVTKTSCYNNDLWEFDIETKEWKEIIVSGIKPPKRQEHDMTYIGNNKAILFGGEVDDVGDYNDTWIYDTVAQTWTEYESEIKPQEKSWHSMAYAGNRNLLLFGGSTVNSTWIFDDKRGE